ncbi:Rieske 2Fe-2S domain-containing protein [Nocardiopsis sp. MG754419]|uniref:Rieske 2Fe-2S domain-containing protein n=1 Tax=Nocardiopsis sp. MG754419 TaxID=2259865 RepID=UPI001BA8C339|nr:Rieske 2Fe-2S domain-containing protein [Nocardiopsis sp. MG754419]MBR8745414.1 (2Fe-2S)-binding protein [Nocardiopsis sp. MG754419]
MRLGERIREIEHEDRLDPVVARVQAIADRLPSGRVRDLLYGVPIGHPLHPVMIHLPMGAWTAAVLLDLLPGDHRRSARILVDAGLLTVPPAVLSGLADWSRLHERQQRVGVVHAAVNGVGTLLFGASCVARARGRWTWGKALALAGLGAIGVGGALGGHLAYYRASGANSADAFVDLLPEGWHDLGPLERYPQDAPAGDEVEGVPVMVARTGGTVSVLVGACPHMGAPLAEGELVDGCVRCPWHGSEFRLDGGTVVHGPATAAAEALETSVVDGRLWVRSRAS